MALLALIGFAVAGESAASQTGLTVAPVFGSGMVLQRDMPLPIWGTAAPGARVTALFRQHRATALADAQGVWRLTLPPQAAGGPDILKINSIDFQDVLVGEVWFGSGQSNMWTTIREYPKDTRLKQLVDTPNPQVRMLLVNRLVEKGVGWGDPKKLDGSALMAAFAHQLQAELKVPVGVIVGAVNGVEAHRWVTSDMTAADEAYVKLVNELKAAPGYAEGLARQEEAYQRDKGKNLKPAPRKPTGAGEPVWDKAQGDLYTSFVQPAAGYGIRGVIWDQGESGCGITGVPMDVLMNALVGGWRKAWNQGAFPFIYMQKYVGSGCAWDDASWMHAGALALAPLPDRLPDQRLAMPFGDRKDAFLRMLTIPGAHMAQTSDLVGGLHPPLKSAYGNRAAQVALAAVYQRPGMAAGPRYASHTIQAPGIRVRFTMTGRGLAAKQGKLQGFMIAGSDRRFSWADAVIDGDAVLVSSPAVKDPVAVRYAWPAAGPWANLFNLDGFPALPFRTDDWPDQKNWP